MVTFDTLFDKYVGLRLQGNELAEVYKMMRDEVVENLTREERNNLSTQCDQWEKERTQPDLSHIQREALKRASLTNITLKITFCPACDAPNAEGFLNCQVCNEPLAVEHVQSNGTTGMTNETKGTMYERHSQLMLKVANSSDRLVLQPQISPRGLKVGRTTESSACDVDLSPFGGDDFGVSRIHAVFRFDRSQNRVVIVDNGSTNGTFINGVRVPAEMESVITDGDELKLARMVFRVKFR